MRAIADTGTMSAAADLLRTSQPAISQQVKRLEERCGTALVERQGRGVRLTEAGWVLAKHGAAVSAAVTAAQEELDALTGLHSGRVRITAFPSISASVVPQALATLRNAHPGVALTFVEAEPPELVQSVRDGQRDLAISFTFDDQAITPDDPKLTRSIVSVPLFEDPMWLVLPQDHPVAKQHAGDDSPLALHELAGQTWIAGCEKCRQHLVAVCRQAGFEPKVAFATDDYSAMMGMVSVGLGIALIPSLFLETRSYADVVAFRLRPSMTRHIVVTTTADLLRVPAVKTAVTTLQEVAAEISSDSRYGLALGSLKLPDSEPVPAGHPVTLP